MSRVTWFDVLFIGALVLMVVLPGKHAPAIRLKEWLSRKDDMHLGRETKKLEEPK